ncbi:MAG: hypothetical protein MUE44_27620 [Oscillatoriaceae cyanobacterium Prado104]|nr:hypothetical protein [Oscillatoriaceae cyanobacterium Prado104]
MEFENLADRLAKKFTNLYSQRCLFRTNPVRFPDRSCASIWNVTGLEGVEPPTSWFVAI